MYVCSKERMEDKIKTFSKFGDAGHGGITRYSLSPEAIMARNEFLKRMKAIGAEIEIDDVANIYATLPGSDPDAKRIVMASHVDSVKNGGNYDGILGVMSAMEVLETVYEKKIPHKHPPDGNDMDKRRRFALSARYDDFGSCVLWLSSRGYSPKVQIRGYDGFKKYSRPNKNIW